MRKLLLFIAILSVTACSTWRSVPDRLDEFVEEAEMSATNYSKADWQESKQRYEALISEFAEHEDEYSQEEKARVMKDIGRYHALMLVNGLNDAAEYIKTMKQILPSYLDGVGEILKESKGDISDIVKSLIDPEGLDKSVKGLAEDWNSLLEDLSSEIESALREYEGEDY